MKRKLIICLIVLIPITSIAQTQMGKYLIDAKTDLSVTSVNSSYEYNGSITHSDYSTFNFTPSIGYFVANNVAAGLYFSASSTTNYNNSSKYNVTTTDYDLGPFARFYFGHTKILPFIEGKLGYAWEVYNVDYDSGNNDDYELDYHGFNIAFAGGIAFILNNYISLNASLGYDYRSIENDNHNVDETIKTGKFGLGLGFSLHF